MSVLLSRELTSPAATSELYSSHFAGIDGLRAIAVVAVIIFHFAAATLPGGFIGVDVFFVISGYVVTASLLRSKSSSAKEFFCAFYARRLVRIYPALIACSIATALAYTLLVPQAYISASNAATAIAAFFGLSNFALIAFDDGYFSPRVEYNAFTHTWSLGVEEQFYLVFPVLLWTYILGRDKSPNQNKRPLIAIVLLVAFSVALSAWESNAAPSRAYYLLPARFWELGVGAIVAISHSRNVFPKLGPVAANTITLIGLSGIAIAAVITDKSAFPYPGALLPVVATAFVIIGVTSGNSSASKIILENSLATYIGRLSYSLYLWHWPVIVLFRWTVGDKTSGSIAAATILTFCLAVASYHLIENPARNSRLLRSTTNAKTLGRGFIIIVVAAGLSAGIFLSRPITSLSVTKDAATWRPDTMWRDSSEAVDARPTFFLLGDSHAWAYSDMAAMLREQGLANAVRHTVLGCSNANLRKPVPAECEHRMDEAITQIISTARRGDFVLLAALRTPRLGDQWVSYDLDQVLSEQYTKKAAEDRRIALQQASRAISRLQDAGLTVIIDAPKPVFPSPTFRCVDWFNKMNPICQQGLTVNRAYLEKLRAPAMESVKALKVIAPNILVWDNFNILCPTDYCSAMHGDTPLFFDGDHLTGHALKVLYPHFKSFLLSNSLIKY